jgi:hypothetical protein
VRLHLYQTGLETAVVGFYRALTHHLMMFPGTVSVQPVYHVAPRKPRESWAEHGGGRNAGQQSSGRGSRNPQNRPNVASDGRRRIVDSDQPQNPVVTVVRESSTFRRGTPWAA